ncbi:MAG: hypothetical protein DMD79_25890 [Candidatus Rokuibacteriota bacterium]|nr:MAG: hypothetical protein DMD79_25890 [Candidatus Rokubacteria bacterium]
MKRLLAGLLALGLVFGILATAVPADAWGPPFPRHPVPHFRQFHHRHFGPGRFVGGLGIGVISGLALGAVLASPVYAAPPVAVYAPPVYYSAPPAPTYWYYCQNPAGYYPYVSQCPRGWLTVVPPGTGP